MDKKDLEVLESSTSRGHPLNRTPKHLGPEILDPLSRSLERNPTLETSTCYIYMCVCTHMYIYIYTYKI